MTLSYKQVEAFILKGKKGESNYNTIEQPFMITKPIKDGKIDFYTQEVNSILENIPIHETLKRMYQVIGNPNIEYYYDNWTLFSLNKVKEHYDIFIKKNQTRAIDFSLIYAGLGHCIIASYDPKLNKIFYRSDGGSSGWDREINFKFAYNFIPTDENCVDLSDWLGKTTDNINVWDIKTVNS